MTPEPGSDAASRDETAALPPPRLKSGDTLAGRFLVVQCLARGGMGEVYEVIDQQLQGKRHALKTLRSDLARNPALRLRFEREVLLAREVHHPNVCPTYDLFHVSDARGPFSFLTMKLLRGESLHARLRRDGPFSPDAALPIAQQLAAALDAAHQRGVVHRDLKPANIMLEEDGAGVHVSVTDFGISRGDDSDETLTQPGQILGTPGYMAPELLRGQPAGFGVDIYAFGIVLYEMLTGRRLDDPLFPTPPSSLVPELAGYWDEVIKGCLVAQPQYRFKSAGEALALGQREVPSARPATATTTPKRSRRGLVATVILAASLGAAWFTATNWEAITRPLPDKRYVALMAWPADASASHLPLLRNALDTIGSRLARAESSTENFTVIAAGDVAGQAALSSPAAAAQALGANLVLTTSVQDAADGIRLQMAIIDTASGRTLRERSQHVAAGTLAHLPDTAAAMAARLLDLRLAGSWRDQDELAALSPAAFELLATADEVAARPNESGLDDAIAKYQALTESQPRFALGYAKLASAYVRKHGRTPERAILTLAERNADLALRYNRDSVAAVLSRADVDLLSGRTNEALTGLQRAVDLDPTNPQVLMVRASVLQTLDRPREEEAVYRQLVRNRPNFWPAYDSLGRSLYRQARYAEAAQVFREGLVVAPQIVRLLNNLGAMQLLLEQHSQARDTFERSVAASPTTTALQNLGTMAFRDGRYAKALEFYQRAQTLAPRNELLLRNLADTYTVLGDTDKARSSYEAGARVVQDMLEINPNRGPQWMVLAYYQSKLARLKEASEALAHADRLGASDVPSQLKKVQILVRLGQREAALTLLVDLRQRGLSREDVDLALDLKDLRSDPRYVAAQSTPRP